MKRLVALALCASVLVTPAVAQYYGGPPGYGGGSRSYDDEDDRPRRGPRWEERREYREDYRRGDGPPRGRFGNACITSRGTCPTRPAPYNSPCGCDIPGFGMKRGNVQ